MVGFLTKHKKHKCNGLGDMATPLLRTGGYDRNHNNTQSTVIDQVFLY